MKYFITIIFLFTQSLSLLAQNYQIIRSDRTLFYGSNEIFAMGVDSLELINGDSILYPFKAIYEISEDCISPFGPSFLGEQIIIKQDGFNIAFNKNNDTIKFKTNAQLGDRWVLFDTPDYPMTWATVIAHDTTEHLGKVDSVKTILFTFERTGSSLITNSTYNIKLSKNFGLISTVDFREFPFMEAKTIPLVGYDFPETGVQNITWFDVYDFELGDIIHTKSSFASCEDGGRKTKQITTILDRNNFVDFNGILLYISYIQKIEKSVQNFAYAGPHGLSGALGTYFSIDTITKTIMNPGHDSYSESNFDQLPGYPITIIIPHLEYAQNRMFYEGSLLAKYSPGNNEYICNAGDCWEDCIIDGSSGNLYYNGLGGPYWSYSSGFSSCSGSSNELEYFEKGDSIWGTPLDLTPVPEYYNAQIQLELFPNPAKKYIHIQLDRKELPATIELFGTQGQLILFQELKNPHQRITLNTQNTGIFMAKITNKEGFFTHRKVFINR